MRKNAFLIFSILFIINLFASCASVKTQGIGYFIDRKESDLIKYFGYSGVESESFNNEYDRVLFFTDKTQKYQMTKVNTVQYKTAVQTEIIRISFNQFSDGCLCSLHPPHNGQHYREVSGKIMHNNDNFRIWQVINEFNFLRNRSNSFPASRQSVIFNRSNIGDSYILYQIDRRTEYYPGISKTTPGEGTVQIIPSERYTTTRFIAWRVNIIAENRSFKEKQTVATYSERYDKFFNAHNIVVTEEKVNEIINDYSQNGYTLDMIYEGHSLYAYIKDDIVVRVKTPE